MKKTLSFCLAATILCCTSITTIAHASTLNTDNPTKIEKSVKNLNKNIVSVGDKTKIKLNEVYVTVPYEKEDINVKYHETDTEVEAEITDKNTNNVLTTIGEEINNSNYRSLSSSSYYNKTVYSTVKLGPTKSRLYGVLNCYNYNNFRQIDSVEKTYWKPVSSGNWTLENTNSDGYVVNSTDPDGPGSSAVISGDANIQIITTSSTSGSFSITALESVGFTVTNSTGSTYYARIPIDKEFTYSLY